MSMLYQGLLSPKAPSPLGKERGGLPFRAMTLCTTRIPRDVEFAPFDLGYLYNSSVIRAYRILM